MAIAGEFGWVGKNCQVCERGDYDQGINSRIVKLRTIIARAPAGYFIATTCPVCPEPVHSRESMYYNDKKELLTAFMNDTV